MAEPSLQCLQALAVTADGQLFAYASSLAVYVFQRQPCQLCKIISRFDRHVVALAFSPYDPNLLAVVTLDQVLMVGCQLSEPSCCGCSAVVFVTAHAEARCCSLTCACTAKVLSMGPKAT